MDKVDQLERIFAAAQDLSSDQTSSTDLYSAGRIAYERANSFNRRECRFSDAMVAARLYGESRALALILDEQDFVYDIDARFYQLLAWVSLPNRDEARLHAFSRFNEHGERLLSAGEKRIGCDGHDEWSTRHL